MFRIPSLVPNQVIDCIMVNAVVDSPLIIVNSNSVDFLLFADKS